MNLTSKFVESFWLKICFFYKNLNGRTFYNCCCMSELDFSTLAFNLAGQNIDAYTKATTKTRMLTTTASLKGNIFFEIHEFATYFFCVSFIRYFMSGADNDSLNQRCPTHSPHGENVRLNVANGLGLEFFKNRMFSDRIRYFLLNSHLPVQNS